jgi:hypothetical protein
MPSKKYKDKESNQQMQERKRNMVQTNMGLHAITILVGPNNDEFQGSYVQ